MRWASLINLQVYISIFKKICTHLYKIKRKKNEKGIKKRHTYKKKRLRKVNYFFCFSQFFFGHYNIILKIGNSYTWVQKMIYG